MRPERPCPHEPQAVAWLQGELSTPEAAAFDAHQSTCASCQAFVHDGRRLLAGLASVSFAPRGVPAGRWRLGLAAAALLVAALGLAAAWWESQERIRPVVAPLSASLAGALARVEERLGADGSWRPAAARGLAAQEVGLHALALLALVRGQDESPRAERRQRIEAAALWLAARQDEDGGLGLPLAEGHFDHAVATLALLEAWRLTDRAELGGSAQRALGHLARHQLPHGAWSPASGPGPATWSLGALLRGESLGFPGLGPPIARGRSFLRARTGQELAADCLWRPPFWRLALGPHDPPGHGPRNELYVASLAVLTPR